METEDKECTKFCNNCKRNVSAINFAIHSAFCERNIFVCKICDEPVQLSEKDQHLEEYHEIAPCDLCKASLEKWMLPKHTEICPKRLQACEYCEAEFSVDKYLEHVEFCSSRTEKCLLCQKYIMAKDKLEHNKFHKLKKQLRTKSIEDDIKQNKVNEIISEKSTIKEASETAKGISSKVSEGGGVCLLDISKRKVSREGQNIEFPADGAAVTSHTNKEFSKHYTKCHICKETIPWIDFNTHVPNCASSAGKCSLCGEDVPSHKIKEHMKKHPQGRSENQSFRVPQNYELSYEAMYRNDQSDVAKSKICDAVFKCPYCSLKYSEDQILLHTRICGKNVYECVLCCKTVCEKDRNRHETTECKMIQNDVKNPYFSSCQSLFECPLCSKQIPEEDRENHMNFKCEKLFYMDETHSLCAVGEDLFECPYCSEKMPQKEKQMHQSFHCKVLIENSGVIINDSELYAEVTKKTCCSNSKCKEQFETCPVCKNKFSREKIAEHRNSCKRLKMPCRFCGEMIEPACEDIHLKFCPSLSDNRKLADFKTSISQNSRSSNNDYKGAKPKNTSTQDMMKPRSAKCKFCCTTYNADVLPNHEQECVHMPIKCDNCCSEILLKDMNSHKCKRKKGKGKNQKREQQPSEENEKQSIWTKAKNFITGDPDKSGYTSRQPTYGYESPKFVPENVGNKEKLYFEDPFLPCEFCQKSFPASELVLHETGCQPHLVSYAKTESFEKPESSRLSQDYVTKDSVPASKSHNISAADTRQPFFTKNNSVLSNAEVGEFLESQFNESYSKHLEYPEKKEDSIEGKKDEPLNIQSVWNARNLSDPINDHYNLKQTLDNLDVEKTQETINFNKNQNERIKEPDQQASDKYSCGDKEMRAMFKFLKVEQSSESDEEYVSLSDENGEPEKSEMKVYNYINSKNNIQEKQGDPPGYKKISNIEESEETYQETHKSSSNIENNQKEYSRRHFAEFRFGAHKAADFSSEDNDSVHCYIQSEKKYGELENIHKQKFSGSTEKSRTSFKEVTDSKLGRSTSFSDDDNVNEKNDKEPEKLLKHKASKFSESCNNQHQANFKLGMESAASSYEENSYCPVLPDKKCGKPKTLYEQKIQKNSDSTNDVKENLDHFKHSIDFNCGAYVSTILSDKKLEHMKVLPENHNKEPEKLYKQNNFGSISSTVNYMDYIRNYRQHLPDFKFGNLETKEKLCEDNVSNSFMPEKCSGKQAFMLEPVGPLKQSKLPCQTTVSNDRKEVGLEEKIAALQKNKNILSSVTNDEKDDVMKWKKWRNKVSDSSDSD